MLLTDELCRDRIVRQSNYSAVVVLFAPGRYGWCVGILFLSASLHQSSNLRKSTELDRRAAELGQVVQEIVKRFEAANVVAANGPHVDLTIQETRVVELLGEAGGQMMRAVAEHLGVAVNSVTSIADGLERKGLLTRVRSESDRRVIHVELTAAGLEASRSVLGIKTKFHRELLAALTEEEQAILLVLLRKVGGMKPQAAPPNSATRKRSHPELGSAEPMSLQAGTKTRPSRSS